MRSSSYPPAYGGPPNPPPGQGPGERKDFGELLTPKTVVSLAVWLMMFGLGAGLSGLILFVVYQGQVNSLRSELLESQEELRKSLEERIETAPAATESPSMNVSEVDADPLRELVQNSAGAIVGITGRDSAGQHVVGSGFSVNTTDDSTWVLTSYKLVAGIQAVTELSVRHKNSQLVGEVYETDPARDLALVIYRVTADRSLRFSRMEDPKEGDQVWAIGNVRDQPYAAGMAARLTTVSATSLGLDIDVPAAYIGGPLLDADGRVLGVLSSSGSGGSTATPINLACQRVLRCPSSARTPGGTPTPGGASPPASGATPPAAPAPPPETAPEEPLPPEEPGVVDQPPASNPNTADVPIG